jgi:tripartite-type tricarboxylate transporter receptor subunit TctC
MLSRRSLIALLLAGSIIGSYSVSTRPVMADEWPSKPIKMIVPFPAGGGLDFVARLVAQRLSTRLGHTVYVENRGGANGAIGLQALKQSEPDGYTIVATSDTPLVVNPFLMQKINYRPLDDFMAVASLVRFPSLIVASPSANIRSLPELIAAAKAKPDSVSYASGGLGNFSHLSMELFAAQSGIKMLHVPYRGSGPASVALLAGEVDVGINNVQVTLQNILAGKLVPVAVGEPERMSVLPDVPTIAETIPGFRITSWAGIVAPGKTPGPIIEKLGRAVLATMAEPEITQTLNAQQIIPFPLDQAGFHELIKSDSEKWAAFIKASNLSIE